MRSNHLDLPLEQLERSYQTIGSQKIRIHELEIQNQQYSQRVQQMEDVIKSFYCKNSPIESALAKEVFDGSYPTLVEQTNHMRRELALVKQ